MNASKVAEQVLKDEAEYQRKRREYYDWRRKWQPVFQSLSPERQAELEEENVRRKKELGLGGFNAR